MPDTAIRRPSPRERVTITPETPRFADGPGTGIPFIDPFLMAWRHRRLLKALVRRDIEVRYRGSVLGVVWLAAMPLALMIAYTFAFGYVFKAGQSGAAGDLTRSALAIFASITAYQVFTETLNRCAALLPDNRSYVKKVAFPLRAFVWVPLLAALVTSAIGWILLAVGYLAMIGIPSLSWLLLPVVLTPFLLFSLGCGYLFAALGAEVRDIKYIAGLAGTVLLFVSPILYPASAIPGPALTLARFNPLFSSFEALRDVLFRGVAPDPLPLAASAAFALLVLSVGYRLFVRLQPRFSDAL